MASKVTPLDEIKDCIKSNTNFVLQGGAGSGKTETLKEVISFISKEYPEKKVCCITHTNLAADEISRRVPQFNGSVCTIHSFLNQFIKNYKISIHKVMHHLFEVPMKVRSPKMESEELKDYNKNEHENYKKIFEKYAQTLAYTQNKNAGKPVGKRDYDKAPEQFNLEVNREITKLNEYIKKEISEKDYNKIEYNETRFNSFNDLSYSHDGLLEITYHLFQNFPTLGQILTDSYDLIFIDEYQDTSELIINCFFKALPPQKKLSFGLFGDSMQAIYDDGIGNVQPLIDEGLLKKIEKDDNYRCSYPVVDFINTLRDDGLEQKVEFKIDSEGNLETEASRQGSLNIHYSVVDSKPNSFSSEEEKSAYTSKLDGLIAEVSKEIDFKILMLTNKSIASKADFKNLYEVFSRRYVEVKDEIVEVLTKLQVFQLLELCNLYQSKKYNDVFKALKNQGFALSSMQDKLDLQAKFEKIWNSEQGIIETLETAFSYKLLSRSDSFRGYIKRRNELLENLNQDHEYLSFKKAYLDGKNTYKRMQDAGIAIDEDTFDEKKSELLKEEFFLSLFSSNLKFREAINYFDYHLEKTRYITMHNTKGSSIDNVLVVLDEYFWNQYKFSELYRPGDNENVRGKTLKITYVACSRAKKNLSCIKLISSADEGLFLKRFKSAKRIAS